MQMELKSILKDKRGMGIRDLYPIILTIAIVGILLGILLMIFGAWQDATNTLTASVSNETSDVAYNISNTTAGTETVANNDACGFNNFNIIRVMNATTGEALTTQNYTIVSTTAGTWRLTTAGAAPGAFNASVLNITYTYSYGGEDCDTMESMIDDFVDFIPWIGIILLIVAAAIVLGIVIKSFAGGRRV